MATWTRDALLAEVRTILNEPTALFWNDTDIVADIDFGARTMSNLSLCKTVTDTVTLAEGTMKYVLAYHFLKIESAVYLKAATTGTGLQRTDFRAMGNETSGTAGVPKYYAIFGDADVVASVYPQIVNFYVWPIPAAGQTGHTVTVRGYVMADYYASSGSATPESPDYAQYAALYFALSGAYTKAGKHSLAALNMQKFLAEANHYRRDVYDSVGQVDSLDRTKTPDYSTTV